MSKIWAGGSTRAWRKVRAFVLERDGPYCQLRLPGCTTYSTQGHHTLGRAITGDDPDYVIGVCQECNLAARDLTPKDPSPQPRTRW